MEFVDVGAVVWILRKCVWSVPDFSVDRYEAELRSLDAQLQGRHSLRRPLDPPSHLRPQIA